MIDSLSLLGTVLGAPLFYGNYRMARHALRAGKAGTAVAIFMLPVVGCVGYYFLEYRPELRAVELQRAREPRVEPWRPGPGPPA